MAFAAPAKPNGTQTSDDFYVPGHRSFELVLFSI